MMPVKFEDWKVTDYGPPDPNRGGQCRPLTLGEAFERIDALEKRVRELEETVKSETLDWDDREVDTFGLDDD